MQGPDTVVAVLRCKACTHMWQVHRREGQTWPVSGAAAGSDGRQLRRPNPQAVGEE
jgi:hypothetical protein